MSTVRLTRTPILAVAATLATAACTDADLIVVMDPPGPHPRQELRAEVCAPPAIEEDAPYKILFVIDTSFSNSWNDPDGRRELAVRNAISEHIAQETVSFGIITFSDQPRQQTFGFTRDMEILDGATQNISATQGGTNYSDTLWAVVDFVLQDANNLNPVELARTHYLVLWLSDGIPTVGVTDTAALTPGVTYLREQLDERAAEIDFSTLYLGGVAPTTTEEMTAARDLLEHMAALGDGTFTDIPAGQAFSFEIDPQPIVNRFWFVLAVANNTNARLRNGTPVPDSDGDGLVDEEELELELDPTLADTDGDGYRDGIEMLMPLRFDPRVPDDGCTDGSLDSDGDGLRDCEELAVGSLVNDADTDDDSLLDSIEVLAGATALDDDPMRDIDMDGVGDWDEVLTHLEARVPEDPETAEAWSYRYTVEETTPEDAETSCYQIQVDNIWMVETLETPDRPRGGNSIELVAMFVAPASEEQVRYLRVELRGLFTKRPDVQVPANGRFEATSTEFADLRGVPCTPGETRSCGTDEGACKAGFVLCSTDGWWESTCNDAIGPSEETCNNIDDDCNGIIDDAADDCGVRISSPVEQPQGSSTDASPRAGALVAQQACSAAGGSWVAALLLLLRLRRRGG